MSRPIPLALVVLASATFALGASAQAGGGVRLSFGGPLGTFVATPTPGYGAGTQSAPRRQPSKVYTGTRTPSAPHVAQRKVRSEPRVTAVKYSSTEADEPTKSPITTAPYSAPGLLSRTLTNDTLPRAEAVRILQPSQSIVATDGKPSTSITATETAAQSQPAPKVAKAAPETCRKFIPAVGVTVTVACD